MTFEEWWEKEGKEKWGDMFKDVAHFAFVSGEANALREMIKKQESNHETTG